METMNLTSIEQESRRIKVTGQTDTIKVEGIVTINKEKKVTQADGTVHDLAAGKTVGNFSLYGGGSVNLNSVPADYMESCARAILQFISSIEEQESAS